MSAVVCERTVPEEGDPAVVEAGRPADLAAEAIARLTVHLGQVGADGIQQGLDLLIDGFGLTCALVRDRDGGLRAASGSLVEAAEQPIIELPLGGTLPAALTVVGAARGQLPLLRVAAAVLGLALSAAPAQELVLLCEQDRDALADALHDGPMQHLVAARYAADAAVRGADVRQARDAVQGALLALRRTIWQLRPRNDNLATGLAELSLRLAEGDQRRLEATVLPGSEQLGPAATALVYRLVQTIALAGNAADDPLAVTVRTGAHQVLVRVSAGCPGLDVEGWDRRARALGGRLYHARTDLALRLPTRARPTDAS